MDVKIISTEMIKPSSPTPNHLRNYKLSLLDQLIPAAYAPIVLFYPNHDRATHFQVLQRLDLLKKSLSETLTRFFPLAGTIKDDLTIDCNDQGAHFTTAKLTKCSLNGFLESPDLKLIAHFLPCGLTTQGFCVANIQATEFSCGGIAVGVCVSHRVLDGAALSNFLKSWANAAEINNPKLFLADHPDHFSASHHDLFPANDSRLKDAAMAMWGSLFKKGKFVTKRFMFDGASIASLKEMGSTGSSSSSSSPTRVEAVSGFIWKYAMAAYSERRVGSTDQSLLTHLVNLRKRAASNLSERAMGNLVWIASAVSSPSSSLKLDGLVEEVRKAVSRVDGDYVKKLRGDDGWNKMQRCLKEMEELGRRNVHHLGFSSWCKLGFYDVDFRWGKPAWVSSVDSSGDYFMNLAVLIDSKCGDGIEAWVTMDEQEMGVLEHNQEFRALASLNPSPLTIV
ncbi:hypothetical protein C2S51_007782 [Perilla frutescens var. frutescens]|nr:hypothetical protein C2S51_007782 [Perilla frutescens var. frutescens]